MLRIYVPGLSVLRSMSSDPDAIIIGAGIAGLSTAAELSRAGLKVLILEARERLGGRIFTTHDPVSNAPIELGAEFIHGRPPEIWNLLHLENIEAKEMQGEDWYFLDQQLDRCDLFPEVDELLQKMDAERPDESFADFLKRSGHAPEDEETKRWAWGYISGFHAADPALVSVHSLVRSSRAEQKIEGDRAFRIPQGYEFLVNLYRQDLAAAGVVIALGTPVHHIAWKPGAVQIQVLGPKGGLQFAAPRVVITVPLGVLQTREGEQGALHFTPPLPAPKRQALRELAMGKVIRVTLCFRERFWDSMPALQSRESKTLSNMRFLFSRDDWFPTWWTTLPEKLPIITGWAPFRSAERLSNGSESHVPEAALRTLSRLLRADEQQLESLLKSASWHDWQADPFSRGAYSYVRVGGDTAQQNLAAALDGTLFFAGEATDASGHNGTVHGAMASGHRAAGEVLRSFSRA